MSAHTPGPWVIQWPIHGEHTTFDSRTIVHQDCAPYRNIAYLDPMTNEREANATLIAAAPDMLEALRIMVRAFDTTDIDPLIAFASIERARAVLAKATGKG